MPCKYRVLPGFYDYWKAMRPTLAGTISWNSPAPKIHLPTSLTLWKNKSNIILIRHTAR